MENSDKKKSRSAQAWGVASMALFFFIIYMFLSLTSPNGAKAYEINYTQFRQELRDGNISSVTLKGTHVTGKFKKPVPIPVQGREPLQLTNFEVNLPSFQGEELLDELEQKNVQVKVEETGDRIGQVFLALLPWVIIILFWGFLMRRANRQLTGGAGGLFAFGQSKAKLYDVKKPRITYQDVANYENVKKELREVIEFLKDPKKFAALGAKIPKGVLLAGPPGTGKTLLARATAGEAGVPFYSINASEFVEMFVGVGAARVRDMFEKAKATKPSIIFIDEIDAVGRTRGTGLGGGHDEREQTLNQLLAGLDGFEPNEEIIVMAATNRPDVLDPALLRPGRFDRQIVIDRPGFRERLAILKVHVRDKKLSPEVDLEDIARGTPGMTGADLENLANEAALIAVRNERSLINRADFEEARDKVLMGTVREESIGELEKRITAYHEAGHALVAYDLPGVDPIHKVTIVPRGMSMGVTQLLPSEDRHFYPKSYLLNRLAVALAGRGAEKLVFNDVSSGAQNDLKEATSLAEKMVAQWGMSEKVGPVNLGRGEDHPFLGRELALPKRYSENMAWLMDEEIQRLINEAEKKAEEVLTRRRGALEQVAAALIKEESLDRTEIEKIIKQTEMAEVQA